MYKSGLVPRRLALVGLIGGPIAFAAGALVLLGAIDQGGGGVQFLLTVPEIVWEASLGIYLCVKGFRPSPILAADAGAVRVEALPAASPV